MGLISQLVLILNLKKDVSNMVLVSGATRYQQSGAVVFLPFRKHSTPEEERSLGLNNNFVINGRQLGSGFGYAIEVLDLNNDGYYFLLGLGEDLFLFLQL